MKEKNGKGVRTFLPSFLPSAPQKGGGKEINKQSEREQRKPKTLSSGLPSGAK